MPDSSSPSAAGASGGTISTQCRSRISTTAGSAPTPPRRRHGWRGSSRRWRRNKKGRGIAPRPRYTKVRSPTRSPPGRLALVLLIEPFLERREIFGHRLARHLAGAGKGRSDERREGKGRASKGRS